MYIYIFLVFGIVSFQEAKEFSFHAYTRICLFRSLLCSMKVIMTIYLALFMNVELYIYIYIYRVER